MRQQWFEFLTSQGGIFEQNRLIHFGNPQLELQALQQQDCITALTDTNLLSVKGADAKTFLQGQVTCNLNDINNTKSSLGAHCNLKGRMQSLFRIMQVSESEQGLEYYLSMPAQMLSPTQQNLKKYALFSKVTLTDENNVGMGLYGPNVEDLLKDVFSELNLNNPGDCATYETEQGKYTLCRVPGSLARFEVWGSDEALKALWLTLSPKIKAVLPNAWELLDIQEGLPTIYPQTMDLVLPHHANLSLLNGISYTKGCYLGQEIIARMQYRGKIKKHLYRACVQDTAEIPSPGAQVCGDPAIEPGLVLRATKNGNGLIEMLVVLDDQLSNFENVCLYLADGPKIHRLDLPYSWP